MQYFTETAPTHREAIELVRAKYGEAAQILTQKTVRVGGFLGLFAREGVELSGYVRQDAAKAEAQKKLDFEDEKRKILAQVQAEQTLKLVLKEVQGIKQRIDANPQPARGQETEHPSIARIDGLLAANDFTEAYRAKACARLRRDFTIEALEDWDAVQDAVVAWIGDDVSIARPSRPAAGRSPRIMVLVGPTGVGKTTTIAKLGAISALGMGGQKPLSVRMVTIDNYRIGAKQQIETYGGIMGVAVSCVETAEDLRRTIAKYGEDTDLILVDTIGKSPRDAVKLAEMKEILSACGGPGGAPGGVETYLALAATTKTSDIAETLRQFEPFGYGAVVLTKLDETNRVGNVVSVLAERGKSLAYFTTGQRVPQDIEPARVTRLLMALEGFRIDREALEGRYAERIDAKSQWS